MYHIERSNDTHVFVRMSKRAAQAAYENGETIAVCGCKIDPAGVMGACFVNSDCGKSFDAMVDNATYYNCDSVSGRYLAYYRVGMARPHYYGRLNAHDQVIADRKRSAWDMAARVTDNCPSFQEFDIAENLLARCTRYAIAQTRHDENETEFNQNKQWYIHEGELLNARRDRLNVELARYGLKFDCLGYFCNNVYQVNANGTVSGYGYLHFF